MRYALFLLPPIIKFFKILQQKLAKLSTWQLQLFMFLKLLPKKTGEKSIAQILQIIN